MRLPIIGNLAADIERERLKRAYPDKFNDGEQRARFRNNLYPPGFATWSLEQRNAWFAGYNLGYCTRNIRA